MDTRENGVLGYSEFRKVINDCKLGLNEAEIKAVFNGFDINKTGTVDYEEFVRIVKVI